MFILSPGLKFITLIKELSITCILKQNKKEIRPEIYYKVTGMLLYNNMPVFIREYGILKVLHKTISVKLLRLNSIEC